jgi:hypothetical protein
MTRVYRAIRFPRLSVLLLSAAAASVLAFSPVQAADEADKAVPTPVIDPVSDAAVADDTTVKSGEDGDKVEPSDLTAQPGPVLASFNPVMDSDPPPSVETPLHHLYCVEYARIRSGFQIFGNANTWWQKARNLYTEITTPAADTVMVFAGSHRISKGHVAVVTKIMGPREIRVDQANWENRGEIDHNTPVLDVSPNNDWSQVRVWNIRTGSFGGHIYAIKGFIQRTLAAGVGGDADSGNDDN